ncbi:hypothetical protein [Aneurinibacillus aneurinilyticus]|uniref:Lipoprotein n=1 Tax=Aneurinibacillus aneurinilyticus TaxID=1391 RepID=A0A848CY46_ANEAE|nr:hypothetical protein [Aneurinibacillus aneurinilyticus]NME99841.1 hypothetical protein [Aneurinibacillus aneurinilyticus]
MKMIKLWSLFLMFSLLLMGCNGETVEKTNNFFIVETNGKSPHWEITNYIIKIKPTESRFGPGKLYYIGPQKDLENVDFYSVSIYLGNGEKVHAKAMSGDKVEFPNGYDDLGVISGETAQSLKKISIEQVENAYAIIKWSTGKEEVTEKIQLKLRLRR